jgi:hypothetical protein
MFNFASLFSSITSLFGGTSGLTSLANTGLGLASSALNTATSVFGSIGSITSDRRVKSDIVAVGWSR